MIQNSAVLQEWFRNNVRNIASSRRVTLNDSIKDMSMSKVTGPQVNYLVDLSNVGLARSVVGKTLGVAHLLTTRQGTQPVRAPGVPETSPLLSSSAGGPAGATSVD